VDTADLEWIAWTNPITTAFGVEVAASDLSGRIVACHQHILPDSICLVGPLLQAGARVRMAPCNPDSTDGLRVRLSEAGPREREDSVVGRVARVDVQVATTPSL
jgi:S-adenosylhomocysteine hydrolase